MKRSPELEPWNVSASAFPGHDAPIADRLRFLLAYAVLAPSSHNTQPWIFRLRGGRIELCADRARALPVVDHDDRELTISCGCALFNLRVAAEHFGYQPLIELLPDPGERDLLATFALGTRHEVPHEVHVLFGAIPRRHTNRAPFEQRQVEDALQARLVAAAEAERAWLTCFTRKRDRHAIAGLVAEGDRIQFADKRFRRELAAWVHANRSHSRDGMPGYAYGYGDLVSIAEPFVIRTFDLGKGVAAKDMDLAEHSPLLAVIGTQGDSTVEWIRAGLALQHVLLLATGVGLSASFLNQPIEVENLRARLAAITERQGSPQLLLRIGYAPEAKPTPRRAADDVLRR
ncbi:MAG: hypothetical protein KIS87_10500 [Phycisphaeraceae bacterium]|nr:hypothetical protein [Phycisphaeraceae bacterium]